MAEPFMPAHEPPAPKPNAERDIDQHVDVLFDKDDGSEPGPAFDAASPAPPFHRPVPGAHLSHDELEHDFPDGVGDELDR